MTYVTTVDQPGTRSLSRRPALAYAREMAERLEDTALMLRYGEGDLSAFEILYRRHSDSLYRYLLRLSLSEQVAEDIFQETWSKLVNARQRYRPTAKFSTYLFRIGHNCFVDYLRRNSRHGGHSDVEPEALPHGDRSPDECTELIQTRQKLANALRALPVEQREAWLLQQEGGFTLAEIAALTDVSRETVKSRLRYATQKLKQAFADAGILPVDEGSL